MARKSKTQRAKDWLVIAFCLSGLLFFVFASADYISQLLSRPISEAKASPAADEAAKVKPESNAKDAGTQGRPTDNELAALFSGASSLALIMFSLLLAFAAIIGWQSLRHEVETVKDRAETILEQTEKTNRLSIKRAQRLQNRLERRATTLEGNLETRVTTLEGNMKTRNDEIEKELRGRVTAVMGLAIGTLHSDPATKSQKEEDEPYLSEAIYHSREAYEKLEKLPGNSQYHALNNLVYYSCLLGVKSGQDKLLEQGRDLREIGRKYRGLAAVPYLVTYTRTVLAFSSDKDQIRDALGTIQEVRSMAGLSKLAEREAQFVEGSLSEKLSSFDAS
ncbi:MAG: hypothetical protein QOH06_5534 [Acidobacteriota bacterium]|jgi:hypothetical protein|nr:hypothetical protein [Acidobacteriota bacterium]